MASVKLEKPSIQDLSTPERSKEFLDKVIDELEYIMTNLDEDNMTSRYNERSKNGKL